MNKSILIIYTGGTIGMIANPETGGLYPFDFSQISKQLPELKRYHYQLDTISFDPPVDSANVNPDLWIKLATIIEVNYNKYMGFVILHGTDTMAYTASALSFMFENLNKPVVITGAQLPIGVLRTDGKENFVSALEIASSYNNYGPIVPEVCIYFENRLYRGNRAKKNKAQNFNAFQSPNYPTLAETGVHIKYNYHYINYPPSGVLPFRVHKNLDTSIAILKMFPGIQPSFVSSVLNNNDIKAIILETYGAGNATNEKWFIQLINEAYKKSKVILNVTQCDVGRVDMGKYDTSAELLKSGIISGYDTTTEAAVTKLMFLLGKNLRYDEMEYFLNQSIRGEITTH